MSKSISIITPEKTDAISRIKAFMSNQDSGVILSATEEKILDRMMFANGLLAERKFTREQIAERIKIKFDCSIYTARIDINNTYSLFVTLTNDYKRYSLFHHIEFMQQKLQQWKDDKSLAHLVPKMADSITKAIAALPVEMEKQNVPQHIILFKTTKNITPEMSLSDAIAKADALIEFEKEHEDVEFEMITDDPTEQ